MSDKLRKRTLCTLSISACAAAVLAAHGAAAQPSLEEWKTMRGEVIEAERLLEADVTNGLNEIGSVSDAVLTEDGSQLQYILYEIEYPYGLLDDGQDGFSTFEAVSFFEDGAFDLNVVLDPATGALAPEEFALTAAEVESRLLSRLVGEYMYFSDGDTARRIEDILIDRQTGEITYYVIETDPEAVFRTERRAVPAAQVNINEQGQVEATMQLAELDDVQDYDTTLL